LVKIDIQEVSQKRKRNNSKEDKKYEDVAGL
jgi:hypothetical protein